MVSQYPDRMSMQYADRMSMLANFNIGSGADSGRSFTSQAPEAEVDPILLGSQTRDCEQLVEAALCGTLCWVECAVV